MSSTSFPIAGIWLTSKINLIRQIINEEYLIFTGESFYPLLLKDGRVPPVCITVICVQKITVFARFIVISLNRQTDIKYMILFRMLFRVV